MKITLNVLSGPLVLTNCTLANLNEPLFIGDLCKSCWLTFEVCNKKQKIKEMIKCGPGESNRTKG